MKSVDRKKLSVADLRGIALATCLVIYSQSAAAQSSTGAVADVADQAATPDEIIVTARKRAESIRDVPVSIAALGKADLEKYGTNNLQAMAAQIPGLVITPSSTSGQIALRGVSSSSNNPSQDQAVSLNVDGVQVGSVQIMRLAQIDLQQVEVLKGPQALFFGKNSPGGIISLRSADPGDDFEAIATASHEIVARESTGTLVISSPLTDTLGVRAVLHGGHMDGYLKNVAPVIPGIAYGSEYPRAPFKNEVFARGTLVFKPTSSFSVRAKYSYTHADGSDPYQITERYGCPYGTAQTLGLPIGSVPCQLSETNVASSRFNPVLTANSRYPSDGSRQYLRSTQHLASIEVNATVAQDVDFTSVSGFYKIEESSRSNPSFLPVSLVQGGLDVDRRELTQELRLGTSRQDWPVNFTVGAYFQDTKFFNGNPVTVDRYVATRTLPLGSILQSSYNRFYIDGTSYSFFGQAAWKIVPTLELAGGARWSYERKRETVYSNDVLQVLPVPSITARNTSPEVTLSWRPNKDLNIFGAYRQGFKSGGFNTGSVAPGVDQSFKPETAEGFELGIKAKLNDVLFNITGYRYIYKGLQVSGFDPARLIATIFNAGGAKVQGIEADFTWKPRTLPGLDLHGSVNYNQARYQQFLANCFVGQTIAEGCAFTPNAGGVFQQQNLRGRQLTLAPDWTGNLGASYTAPISPSLKFGVTVDANYTSGYFPMLEQAPASKQGSRTLINASLKLAEADDRWEIALIGQNLTNRLYSQYGVQIPFTGISSRTGTALTGGQADVGGYLSRPRQVTLQATVRF